MTSWQHDLPSRRPIEDWWLKLKQMDQLPIASAHFPCFMSQGGLTCIWLLRTTRLEICKITIRSADTVKKVKMLHRCLDPKKRRGAKQVELQLLLLLGIHYSVTQPQRQPQRDSESTI